MPDANAKVPARYLALIAITYALCIVTIFIDRGPWLDEFWTMWMTDPHLSFVDAYRQRWSTDLHPPLYYSLVWLMRHVTGDDYVSTRVVNLFPFLIFVPTLALWHKYRSLDAWLATFLTVMTSTPFLTANAIDLRSYYTLTVLGACLIMLLRIGRSLPADAGLAANKWFLCATAVTVLIALNLHYSGSLIYLIVISVELAIAVFSRKLRWALFLAAVTGVAGLILVSGLLVTLRSVPNFSYLNTGPEKSAAFIVGGMILGTLPNLGIDVAILLGLFKRGPGRAATWGLSLATFLVASLALFLQSLMNHAMGLKYVLDLIPLGSAFIADLVATRIFASGVLIGLMALSAVSDQAITAWHEYGNQRWVRYADRLRDLKAGCPTTQFVGVDQNALPEFVHHPMVSGWIGAFGEGYATVGRVSGVHFVTTSNDRLTNITLDKCPLALLSDHEVKNPRLSLPELLRQSRVSVSKYRYHTVVMHDYQRLFVLYP